ncbi:MAG TPA: hypothetical protein EYG12_07205 [Gammaproteobacteria bacterium]|nr:hypothetical protein [Gammaproteobacteria bacterium]
MIIESRISVFLIVALVLLMPVFLPGCSPTVYGIQVERWDMLSEKERIAVIQAYQEKQNRLRIEAAARQAEAKLRLKEIEKKIKDIYNGDRLSGDLIQVSLDGGKFLFHGDLREYESVSFRIATGESKTIGLVAKSGKWYKNNTTIKCSYANGVLLISGNPYLTFPGDGVFRAVLWSGWDTGKDYIFDLAHRSTKYAEGINAWVRIIP